MAAPITPAWRPSLRASARDAAFSPNEPGLAGGQRPPHVIE
jgi:hypothetical protein